MTLPLENVLAPVCYIKSRLSGSLSRLPESAYSPIGKPEWVSESRSVMSDSLWPHGLVLGIPQARILEWVAFPFSRASSQGVMAPFYFGYFCFPYRLVGLNKMVNWGKLKIIKKMSSCRNRRGNVIQDTNCSKQQVLRVVGRLYWWAGKQRIELVFY